MLEHVVPGHSSFDRCNYPVSQADFDSLHAGPRAGPACHLRLLAKFALLAHPGVVAKDFDIVAVCAEGLHEPASAPAEYTPRALPSRDPPGIQIQYRLSAPNEGAPDTAVQDSFD